MPIVLIFIALCSVPQTAYGNQIHAVGSAVSVVAYTSQKYEMRNEGENYYFFLNQLSESKNICCAYRQKEKSSFLFDKMWYTCFDKRVLCFDKGVHRLWQLLFHR